MVFLPLFYFAHSIGISFWYLCEMCSRFEFMGDLSTHERRKSDRMINFLQCSTYVWISNAFKIKAKSENTRKTTVKGLRSKRRDEKQKQTIWISHFLMISSKVMEILGIQNKYMPSIFSFHHFFAAFATRFSHNFHLFSIWVYSI